MTWTRIQNKVDKKQDWVDTGWSNMNPRRGESVIISFYFLKNNGPLQAILAGGLKDVMKSFSNIVAKLVRS